MNPMKLLKIFILAALFAGTAMAQGKVLSGFTWNIAMPTGRLTNFMDKTSYGGFGFETHSFLTDDFSVGGSVSWNYWSEMTGETIPLKQGALSGTQIRYVNSIPLLLNATFYLGGRRDEFRPFFGLNAGAYYILQRLDMGIYSLDNDHWHFGLAPEAGFLLQVSSDTYLTAAGRYNYGLSSGETVSGDSKNTIAYWGINIGIAYTPSWF
jgi:outer membrane protein W